MPDPDVLTDSKLIQLLEAIEAVMAHEDAEEAMGVELMREFAAARTLVREWLLHKSPLTLDQRLHVLQVFTEALARRQLAAERRDAPLH
ncbi:hypothetical protein RHDC4_02580 [Rhodocyclaceae bacterium]|nr:hypothetical protein RHDC4_02580 [Rhodocyclaceae bacterium]